MPPNRFESEVESFLEGSHGDRTHNKQRADHHTVTPLCGTLLWIGTVLLDSSLTYPERKNLFRLLFPIQFGGVCRPGGLLAAWQWGFCTT